MFGHIKSGALGRADRQPITDARASLVNNKLTPGNNCLAQNFYGPGIRPERADYFRRAGEAQPARYALMRVVRRPLTP